jgi:uncharacterized protein (TIGR02246 family)
MAPVIPKDRRGKTMPARSPHDICRLFQQYMAEGDIDAVLSVYDPEAVFLNQSGQAKKGTEGLRQELAPFAARKVIFEYDIKQVIEAGEIALMHTQWKVTAERQMTVYAIEVARRQPDGTWRWLIGDPFTVGRLAAT